MTKKAVVDEPLPSVENENNTDEKQSVWSSILRDVKSSAKKAPTTKSLVVLGDNESGRTTLVAKLQGNEDPKRGAGLEYHYIDVKDDDQDDTPKLGVWILDGDVACSAPLLKFAMKPETIENAVLILVASMTQPWSLLSTLKKWTILIEEHIDRLKIDPTRLREMRDHLQYDFQYYIEPNDSTVMLTSSASSTTIKNGVGGGRVPNSVSSVSLATPLSPSNGDEQVVLPLPDGVLTKSLGIPVIVVITKCDVMSTLEKENDYKDEYFDFMQHHLRKFCLEYGAALFYTSVKEKKNIDKLYKYIVHICYGYPFTSTAAIVERDGIFIPSGWDNPKKADILLENLHRLKSTDNYSDVFVKPVVRRPLQRDNEIITAEDDQEFLAKLQSTLNRAASPGRGEEPPTSAPPRQSISSGGGSQTPSGGGRQRAQQNPAPGNAAAAGNEGALANFFNSLLTRKSGGAVTPTAAGAPATQRQTSQSPTTPSSKRLQQHPLTFAVTPPPARTKTPTSHKGFPSALNMESSPKLLSPVVEQQIKVAATSSASPTVVRTPVEDIEPTKIPDVTEDKQSVTTNGEPVHLNHNEIQSNDPLRLEKEPITNVDVQNTTSQHDLISNTINNSNTDTLNSPFRSSPLIENNSIVAHDALTEDNHRRLSNDFSLSRNITQEQENEIRQSPSAQSPITEIPGSDKHTINNSLPALQSGLISPSQYNEFSNAENQNNIQSTNRSRSPSPVIHDNNKRLDQSPTKDDKLPGLSSSPTFENKEQLSNKEGNEKRKSSTVSQEEVPQSPVGDVSSNNNHEAQQDSSKQSLNSSRRNSAINSSIPSRPLSPVSSELHQQEDKTLLSPAEHMKHFHSEDQLSNETLPSEQADRQASLTDIRESESPIRSRPVSPAILETSEVTSIDQEQNDPLLSQIEQTKKSNIPNETLPEDSLISQSPRLLSTSNLNTSEEEHQDHISTPLSDTDHSQNHLHSPVKLSGEDPILHSTEDNNSSFVSENHNSLKSPGSEYPPLSPINDQRRNSSLIEDTQQKSPTHETTLSSSPLLQDSDSTEVIGSSTLESNDIESDSYEITAPLPITDEKYERSRSPSPTHVQKQERSRSPSPTIVQEHEENRSVSPVIEQKQHRSRSPSPTIAQEHEQNRSVSPVIEQKQHRSRSPSPTILQEHEQNRPVSPVIEQKQYRSRSPSPNILQEHEENRSVSPVIEQKQHRSRSPLPTFKHEQEQGEYASSDKNQHPDQIHSESSIYEEKQKRSRTPSPVNEQKEQRSLSSSTTPDHNQDINRSSSPVAQHEPQRSRSPSPTFGQEHTHGENTLPITEQNRSESPAHEHNHQRSSSPSLNHEYLQQNNQSLSPDTDRNSQQSQFTSVPIEQKQERSRSPSLTIEQNKERSRSPSPNADKIQERNPSLSVALEENHERNRTPSPVIEQKQGQERSRSPSPSAQENQERSRSPSFSLEQHQERNRSPSPITELKEGGSPSLTSPHFDEQNEQRNRSPSPLNEQKQQGSRSSSPNINQKSERSRSPSLNMHEDQEKDSFPIEPLEHKLDSTENQGSTRRTSDHYEIETQSPNKVVSSPIIDEHEQQQLGTPTSAITENERRYSSSHVDDNTLNSVSPKAPLSPLAVSPKLEEAKSPQLSTGVDYETLHNLEENAASSPIVEHKQSDSNRSPSPKSENELLEEKKYREQILNNNDEQLDKSPLTEKHEKKPSLIPSPVDHQATSVVKTKTENQISPLASPLSTSFTENQSIKSPVNEHIPSTTVEKQYTISPSPTIDAEHPNLSNASPIPSTQRSSIDHNPSHIPPPPVDRQSSITRSHSQSTLARPNTLRFSPNNHDLDGLYMSSDYNDEDETLEDNEHHHSSAPSTVSVEYRRSSLLHGNNIEQKHTPIAPNDISKRLSIVEKSRMEDSDTNVVDPTDSKGT